MALRSMSRFVAEVRALYAALGDPAQVWPAAKAPMAALLKDPQLAALAKDWPVSDHENLLFYEDPDFGFVVNGLIKDPGIHAQVLGKFIAWAIGLGFRFRGLTPSPILGATGNREFFVLLQRS